MPFRDHFRPPIFDHSSWQGFHGMWPAVIVQHLVPHLPDEYIAEPTAKLGADYEIDVSTFAEHDEGDFEFASSPGNVGLATATWAPPKPTLSAETELNDQYEYEVRVYDRTRARKLVAAVELASPANKDRPENRRAFVRKCAALLQQDVCVSIVDLVTVRNFNLYLDVLAEFNCSDESFQPDPPATYAVTCRGQSVNSRLHIDTWAHALTLEQLLPTLPLCLTDELAVPLELEKSYEETCRTLRIIRPAATPGS